uniref:SGNH hydrolase-type esterase domain-containing protein n=1 Tax=Plectus sambesii TaxID=2011161 RepID=A0A914UK72_9BILA
MHALICVSALCFLLVDAYPRTHRPKAVTCEHVVIFGDSLTDDGVEAEGSSHGFNRYSNGPVWAEYLNNMLECVKYDNYAYAGATSGMDNFYFPGWSGVLWQVTNFLTTTPVISEDTLIIVQLGGNNDMFNGENKTTVIAENARRAVTNLALHGARKVLALNLVDLSEAPGVQNADGGGEIGKWISLLTSEANMRLRSTLYNRHDGITITFPRLDFKLFDFNGALAEANSHFMNVSEPYTHHRPDTSPSDINYFAFHDLFHPSTFVHYKLAQAILRFLQDWV